MALTIDDFTSGPHSASITTGADLSYQAGSMLGEGRYTQLFNALNPRNQPAHLDVGSADRLNLTLGAENYVRLEVGYGWVGDGAGGGTPKPLGENLHAHGDAIRASFHRASGVYAVNFNVVAFTSGGWTMSGENVSASQAAFNQDFPFSSFNGPGGQDFSDVSYIVLVFQTFDDLALDSFEVV